MKKITYFRFLLLALILLVGSGSVAAQYSGMGTFTKITDLAEVTDGYYVLVNSGDAFAMNNTMTTFFGKDDITPASGVITNPSTTIVWKIETNGGGKTIYSEASTKYVSYTGSANAAQAVDAVATDNQRWTFTYEADVFVVSNLALPTRMLQYNASSPRFACYTSAQQKLLIYKLGEAPTTPTIAVGPVPAMTSEVGTTDTEDITVNGVSLTANITLAVTGADAALFTLSNASLAPTDGSVSETVTVTYTPTAAGEHVATLTLSSTSADDVVLSLSGVATWAPLADPVATAASGIGTTVFTANWDAVVGATEYELSVYEKEGSEQLVLDENLDLFAAGSTNASAHGTDVAASLDDYTGIAGWTGSKVYQAGGAVKMGTSSVAGYLATPTIDLSANDGDFTVEFDAMAWSGDATEVKILLDDVLVHTQTGLNNSSAYELSSFSVSLTGGTATSQIKFEAVVASKGRFFLDNIIVKQGSITTTPVAGSPFTVTGANSKEITGLAPTITGTTYYYTVVASNTNVTSEASNEIEVTTEKDLGVGTESLSALNKKITAYDGKISFTAKAGEQVQVYNAIGQQLISRTAVDGLNTIPVTARGIMVVKVGNRITKLIL